VLVNACLRGANLQNANFSKDNQGGATDLHRADLSDAIVVGARFDGARYDVGTSFPERFRPEQRGLVLDGPKRSRR